MDGGTATAPAQGTGVQTTPDRGLRILAVGNMYPPHHAGGYELMWQAAMRHAAAAGHRVRVLTTDYRVDDHALEDDPDVHRTLRWYWDLDRYEFPRLSLAQRLRLERHNHAELRRHIEQFGPDLVTWWSMGCMSLSLIEQVRRTGTPAGFVVHDDWLVYGRSHDQWIRLWRGRRKLIAPLVERLTGIATEVDFNAPIVFNSRYTRERARNAGIEAPRMTVVHPGIDESFLEALPPEPWSWRLAYIGRIDRQKGVDTAVRALAHLPVAATLTIWGTGDDEYVGEMRALAVELGIADRVRFAGWAGEQAVRDAYAATDAIVFPVRWEEPFGLVPLEAMGLGRLVVTTVRGGGAEYVREGENALAFAPDDAAGLATCVTRLAQDDALRTRLRDGGMRTAARYTLARFAEQTVAEMARTAGAPALSAA